MEECKKCTFKDSHGTICAICMENGGKIPQVNEVGL